MATLTERLQLIVDATTSKAEASFSRLTGAAKETGAAATTTAEQVRAAADRVAAARERETVAAGNLSVAQRRLDELRATGRARASQLEAAENRVAAAQRASQMAASQTSRAQEDLARTQRDAGQAADDGARSTGRLQGAMQGLMASAVSFASVGLGAVLRGAAEGFATGARDAGQLARMMNATTEEAGALLGLVGALGLDLNDLSEITAEFAQKAQDSAGDLEDLGVQVQRNADGTINWSTTLVEFLDRLQGVQDATVRNRLGFQFLGEEGFKQLSRLVNSGVDVRDALEQIGTPFTDADLAAVAEYDAALLQVDMAGTRISQTLGRALLPAVAGIAEGLGDVIDVVTAIPAPVAVATAAALALGITGFSPTAAAGARLATVTALATRNLVLFRAAAAIGGSGAALMGATMGAAAAGMGAARAGAARLMGVAGGPLGVALIAGSVAMAKASDGAERLTQRAREAAIELGNMADQDALNIATRKTANDLEETAGYWERSAAYVRGYEEDIEGVGASMTWLTGPFQRLTMGFGDTADTARGFEIAIEEARKELGELGVQQGQTQQATRTLTDLIAQGTTSGQDFADAVGVAADAQQRQETTSGLAEAAIAAYNATTRDAVQVTLDLHQAQLSQSEGLIGLQQAIHDASSAVEDLETPWSEVDEATNRVISSTLSYAGAAADAAVEAARAAGTVLDPLTEARIRGEATIKGLYGALAQPGITDSARKQVQDLIHDLQAAQEEGDVEAILRLTGAAEAQGELDETTQDRDATVRVESRNGPAVKTYLDGLANARRLSLIRVESRNGPAVRQYLDGLASQERLSLIRVESRNGPAVDQYLDSLASQRRVAIIDVQERAGSSGGAGGGTGLAGMRGAPAGGGYGSGGGGVTIQSMTVQVAAEGSSGRLTQTSLATAGRQYVAAIGAYERQNGPGWRQGGQRR